MESLHQDIKLNILSRLPVESVYQCKLVCKPWRDLLRNNKVGLLFCIGVKGTVVQLYYGDHYDDDINIDEDHYDNYALKTLKKMAYPPITERPSLDVMLGSCNGLVCFFVPHHGMDDPVYICNPVTCEYVYLPRFIVPSNRTSDNHDVVGGFGYNYSTDEYKVVRIYYDYDQPSMVGQVQVYTLGSGNGWRNKGNISYTFAFMSVFVNGVIHFIDNWRRKIVAFDLADEEFRLLPYPPSLETPGSKTIRLCCFRGYLCLVHTHRSKDVDIWAYKKKDSNCVVEEQDYYSWSWSKVYSIVWEGPNNGNQNRPFAFTKSNQVLMYYGGILSCYDPRTATAKKLCDDERRMRYFQTVPHINSLVSLKALGEKSATRR